MIYNLDYEKIKRLGIDNYDNSLSNPNQNKIATLGINNYTDDDEIYNIEETLCMFVLKINEIIDVLNGIPNYDELLEMLKIILNFLKDIDLKNYYNKQEINKMFDDLKKLIPDPVDLKDYYTKEEIDELLKNLRPIVDLSNYYNKQEISQIIKDTQKVPISKYYINIDILENQSTRQNDKNFINFKVKKNDGEYFERLFFYKVGYIQYKGQFPNASLSAVGRGISIEDYVVPCSCYILDGNIIAVSCYEPCSEIRITGSILLSGEYDNNLIFSPVEADNIEPPKNPAEFKEYSPNEIREILISNGYNEVEEDSTKSILLKGDIRVTFYKVIGTESTFDRYEINNDIYLVSNITEVKRILGYTFKPEEVDFILSRQEPDNHNWINLTVRNKNVSLMGVITIGVVYGGGYIYEYLV